MIVRMGNIRKFSPHVRSRMFTPEEDAQVAQLYRDGMTFKQLTERFPVSETAIRNALKRAGCEIRPRRSHRPDQDWPVCACGGRVTYPATGQCAPCYAKTYNADPVNRERKFNWWLQKHHGMTRADYDAMLAAQNGVCAVHLGPDPRGVKLAIDHNHSCCPAERSCPRCRRGLLCVHCNRAVGLLGDSADNAARLLDYLLAHKLLLT
jgi:hypothetical protein